MAVATTTQSLPPSQSLYIQNLPDKYSKPDLRRTLYTLFSTYGPVLDVTALKTPKMRGQAHILFREVHSATQAMRSCQGMEIGGKEMRIQYAKTRSNTLAKLTGTFNQPVAKPDAAGQGASAAATFAAIPGAASTAPGATAPPPAKAADTVMAQPGSEKAADKEVSAAVATPPAVAGTKRARDDEAEEEEENDSDAEMEVEDEEMEMSEGDDD
ncbi:hypothetical protein LTR53_016307 [Teratosphaeriaceae sp. CCFEE 6253]|nr:hypothetical protein LTR53_016307 [Teratosphaeriaceae sp. CCFEE 6253]